MAQDLWSLKEDGYLNVELDCESIVYHPTLNIILVTTRSGYVHVLDVNSGVALQTSSLSVKQNSHLICRYLEDQNKVLFLDGQALGVRSDYNGVLLLDTILQRRLKNSDELVKLELLLSEAVIFQQSLKTIDLAGTDIQSEVTNELSKKISQAQSHPKTGIKAQKWNTICLEVRLSTLRAVAQRVVSELKRLNRHVPALAIAAAINERLSELAPRSERCAPGDRALMYSEAKRRETFARWPHMDYKWALPEQMAQAGFYHQPNSSGDDRAMCFTCAVCLVCWERTDEPWSEHERHSPCCPFVKGEYTQNVPLSVTYATSPALDSAPRMVTNIIANSNVGDLIALGHSGGMVSVYSVAGKLKRTHCFCVTHADHYIPEFKNSLRRENIVMLTALSIVGEKKVTNSQIHKTPTKSKTTSPQHSSQIRPSIICGITVTTDAALSRNDKAHVLGDVNSSVQALNDHNQQKNELVTGNCLNIDSSGIILKKYLYLVVYDFQYKSAVCDQNDTETKNLEVTETPEETNEKSDIFLKNCADILMSNIYKNEVDTDDINEQLDTASNHATTSDPPLSITCDISPLSYKNFIPPENDKIFLPPEKSSETTGGHEGPRLCTDSTIYDALYMFDKDIDYSFTNGQLDFDRSLDDSFNEPGTSSDKSISDHISELKSKIETKTVSYSHAVQCVMLPESCQNKNLEIFEIIPTRDGQHILVVLRSKELNILATSYLLVYALDFTSRVIKIGEKPILKKELSATEQPEEVSMLPLLEGTEHSGGLEGLVALVCADGAVRLVDLATLNIVSEAKIEGSRYVSATYCNSLERLCVSTERGPLHFYAILGHDNDFVEERDDDDYTSSTVTDGLTSPAWPGGSTSTTRDGSEVSALITAVAEGQVAVFSELLNNIQTFNTSELRLLTTLCQCEERGVGYCAVLPPCWSEMQQCQQRGKDATSTGGSGITTRTWRLQTDATTWDEHVLELTLPWGACVGHVDLRFSLHAPCPALPNIQVTLLKQHASGIGLRKFASNTQLGSSAVDESVEFSLHSGTKNESSSSSGIQNPVLTEEYLRAHNADILAGPVSLSSCLDLTENGGCVTLTSPKLLRARGRTLLVHIKALLDLSKGISQTGEKKEDKPGSAPKKSRMAEPFVVFGPSNGGSAGGGSSSVNSSYEKYSNTGRKTDYYIGCDWLHEISITIRNMNTTNHPNERAQRVVMVESNNLVEVLCNCACRGHDARLPQMLALDILEWIAAVRLGRRGNELGAAMLRIIMPHLYMLIMAGFIDGTRSLAHKLTKLLLICIEGGRNMTTRSMSQQFDSAVLQALLRACAALGRIRSASALHWFTLLLQNVTPVAPDSTATECLELIKKATRHLQNRTNPYHQLLRSRFGLFAIPFEPELFDVDPPPLQKSTSAPVTFASVVSGDLFNLGPATNTSAPSVTTAGVDSFDPKELFNIPGISTSSTTQDSKLVMSRCRGLIGNNHTRGLLESEPLHYSCLSASDGTRMERFEQNGHTNGPGAAATTAAVSSGPFHSYSATIATLVSPAAVPGVSHQHTINIASEGTQKVDNDLSTNVEEADGTGIASMYIEMKKEYNEMKKEVVFLSNNDQIIDLDKLFNPLEGGLTEISDTGMSSEKLVDGDGTVVDVIDMSVDSDTSDGAPAQNDKVDAVFEKNYQENCSSLSDKQLNEAMSSLTYNKKDTTGKKTEDAALAWQQLLLSPPQQMLVVERMHSGARRFVVLDFGAPVLLTDVLIPACSDLVSLSIDVWWQGEETDSVRLAIASDIGSKCLVLSDLQPPPLCRYMKITIIGRYGMSTTRCKIPIGNFYGHILVLPEDTYGDVRNEAAVPSKQHVEAQLEVLTGLLEDVNCRYTLACSKLKDLLNPLLVASNSAHMSSYFKIIKDSSPSMSSEKSNTSGAENVENAKILSAYQECVTFQHQLNLVRNVMRRLEAYVGRTDTFVQESEVHCLTHASTDKLHSICESLSSVLLSIVFEIGPMTRISSALFKHFDQKTCEELFMTLCVSHDIKLQLSVATLLVRMCGLQSWWGEFLTNCIMKLYSSNNTMIFPQERVFIIIAFLCRKSLSNGASRSAILDPTLRSLCTLLTPLADPTRSHFVAASIDLGLLGWLLLFLSFGLDSKWNEENSEWKSVRWDWLITETSVNKSQSHHTKVEDGYRRKLHKRFLRYKQHLDHLDLTQKAVQASTQAFSALSNHAASLSSKLEAALEQQESFFKKMKQISCRQIEDIKSKSRRTPPIGFQRLSESTIPQEEGVTSASQTLNHAHCEAVARGLLTFMLSIDCSCSADLFLLACKTVARLVAATRPALMLQQLLAPHHLVELLRLGMQRETNPWISHAIACLLRDILDRHRTTDKNTTDIDMTNADGTSDMETDSQNWMQPSESETPNDILILKNLIVSEDQDGLLSDINSIAVPLKSNGVPLPSLPESDDSEFDDVLDMLECCRYLLRKSSSFKSGVLPVSNYSTAIDARLDVGLDSMFEIILRRLTMISSCFLPIALCGSLAIPPSDVEIESTHSVAQWSDELTRPWTALVPHSEVDSFDMLTQCFEILFAELEFSASSATLEQMLQLYIILSVNVPESTTRNSVIISSCTPRLTTSPAAISSLLAALVCQPTISLCLWTSAFQFLTLAANLPAPRNASSIWNSGNDLEQSLNGLAAHIFQDGRFMQMLLRFLSGTGVMLSDKKFVGPTVCQSLHELLMRLQVRTDVVTPNSRLGVFLKEMLLRILCQLLQTGTGAIACYRGPLDAQCKFVQSLLNLDFVGVDLSVILSILENLGVLVYTYMLQTDVVKCVSLAEQSNTQSSCFGSLFSSVLGPDSNKHGKPASHNSLIVSLLKLATKLVQIPLPATNLESPSAAEMSTSTVTEDQNMSQTDESKVEQRGRAASDNGSVRPKIPCITDLILQQHVSTVLRLCHSLSACGGSSLAMLLGAMPHRLAVSEISEPATIADGVFQLLETLTSKATDTCLLLRPLLEFLSPLPASSLLCQTRTQLSEPLVWWFLQVLGSEPALREFTTRGGINMLATHLVRCHQAAISMLQPGSISEVMQHLSSNQNVQSSSLAYQAGASNSKKIQQANLENSEALINFAPLGVITSTSPTAQPADVLIQTSVTPHRRARTPQWSYHFYPDETHVELCISLPAAILLRELQLQPHLNSLATCPSAIALEVSRTGTAGLMPVCPPLTTSGMSFIRLHLPQPEVVTTVLIRLYRPRDSTNIGLLHIRLLGTPTFKGVRPAAELCDEERLTRSSLGWLRLLYQCFDLPSSDLAMQVVSEAAKVPNLLETCCGLLLIPTQIPPLFIPNLEQVLLRLSLQDPEFGLRAIQTLLKNNAVLVQSTQKQSERAVKSVCELIFKLCTTQDHNTHRRIATVLDWLRYEIDVALENQDGIPPCSSYVHCTASILWSAYHSDTMCSVKNLITRNFFERVYKWNVASTKHVALKKSIDALLCAMCVINSDFFPILLVRMSVLVPNLSTDRCASVSDDQKDCESMTDDIKQNLTNFESDVTWCGQLVVRDLLTLLLDSNQLQTIANASQSSKAARQLLDSGLPNALVSVVLDFCTACSNAICNPLIAHTKLDELIQETCREYPMVRVDRVVDILNFFADCSMETTLRQWLGSPDGSVFWIPLLRLLCHNNTTGLTNFNCIQSNSFYKLQDATIQFLSKCCSLCSKNQTLLAKCLCDVIENSTNVAHGISGFTRRLILQLLLENEKVWVYIKADETIYKNTNILTNDFGPHPAYRITNHHILLYLNVNTTLKEILDHHISFTASLPSDTQKENILPSSGNKDLRKEMWEVALDMNDQMSVAAGVTAKDKRAKDVKNLVLCYSGAPSNSKKKRNTVSDMLDAADKNGRGFRCDQLCHLTLAPNMRLGHLLGQLNTQVIELTVIQSKDSGTNMTDAQLSSEYGRLESPLQVFSRIGGLATLAQHLPLVYPDHLRSTAIYQPVSGPSNDSTDADWVKVEGSDDIYEDLEDSVPAGSSTPIHAVHVMPNVPPHSLAAFGLFLRLPGYADALLADYKKAQCLLRLVLGVTDDGEGGDIFTLPIALALPTLPFQVLRRLYDGIPVAISDNQVLRHTSIELGVVRLLLNCLSVFTHYANDTSANSGSTQADAARPRTDDKSHLYWAKGTGFGTGSMQQSWNVEQALLRQRSEEEHVTVLLQVLSSYISPQGSIVLLETTNMDTDTPQNENGDSVTEDQLPPTFYNLLLNSCLLPALCSYLRNDSVLDMARHIPLYRAILQLLRAMASRPQLIGLLLPQRSNSNGSSDSATSPLSIISLLNNMKLCVDTYASRLQIRKSHQSTGPIKSSKYKFLPNTISSMAPLPTVESSESDEGLALLIPDIQATAELVRVAALQCGVNADDSESTDKNGTDGSVKDGGSIARPFKQSLEQRYLEIMKRLQFDTFEMIKECSEAEGGGYQFVVSYHFENNVRAAGDRSHPARVKRLAQEAVTLATSLPLSYSSSVFVRCDTDRLDVMKVLITGPADTPYANGCFELDVYFPPDYPQAPMMINLETTGRHTVRFNPNLYNDGKVCLSVLNTWHGRPEEKWNAQTSSFLQVLVSIQSLILVPEPYFNEPGYERSRGTPSGTQSSLEYNANICQATVRWAMLEQIRNPCPCFKRVIHTHFWLKRHEIASQIEKWISELEVQAPDKRTVGRTSSKRTQAVNALALKHHYMLLHDELSRLKTPEGLEDLEEASAMESFPPTVTSMFMADSYPSAVSPVSETTNSGLDAAAPSTNAVTTADVHHDIDTDVEMEKMVSKVCE